MASRKSKGKSKGKSRLAKRLKQRFETKAAQRLTTNPNARLIQLKPKPMADEPVEDLAVFAKARREELSSALQTEAGAVRESLELVYQGDFGPAMDRVKIIPRNSPLSDWRLFVRGLIAFYHGDVDTARQDWSRLDRARRPARIASTLLCAETEVPLDRAVHQPPSELVEPVRELYLRRGAVTAARQLAAVRHPDSETTFSASQVAMLTELCDQYQEVDGQFVARFAQGCVRLAYFQPNTRIFELLKKHVPGPPHDPHWNLLGFSYFMQFSDAEDLVRRCAANYVLTDLLRITQLPQHLKDALASVVHVTQAQWQLHDEMELGGPFSFRFSKPDVRPIEKLIREAIRKYPANRKAHEFLIQVLHMQLDDRDLTESRENALENQIVQAKEQLLQFFPDDVKTMLWLIDHYLDTDEFEKADTLVGQLGGQRLDDPSAKALPWKLKLLEAMRLSRRKTNSAAARVALEAADSLWPAWLSRAWLPFLHAALELRAGDQAKSAQLMAAARQAGGAHELVADVMAFAALQQMNLPSTRLKPWREIVERHASRVGDMPLNDLCALGSFFWDLTRTGLRHKGYRLQAGKFGKALCERLAGGEPPDIGNAFSDACSWVASHRFWQSDYGRRQPNWIADIACQEPRVAAAVLEQLLDQRYAEFVIDEYRPHIETLGEAVRTEKDPFYRHRFETIATEAKATLAMWEARRRNRTAFSPYDDSAWDEDDEDDEDEDSFWTEDAEDDCNCPQCRARRAREASASARAERQPKASRANYTRTLFDLDGSEDEPAAELEDDAFDDGEFDDDIPPIIAQVFSKLGPSGARELQLLLDTARSKSEGSDDLSGAVAAIGSLFRQAGLSIQEEAAFLIAIMQGSVPIDFRQDSSPRQPQPAPASMTAEERRALDKERQRQLRKKMRKRR